MTLDKNLKELSRDDFTKFNLKDINTFRRKNQIERLQCYLSSHQSTTLAGTECTAEAISIISDLSFSIAFPTTIMSAPALQFR